MKVWNASTGRLISSAVARAADGACRPFVQRRRFARRCRVDGYRIGQARVLDLSTDREVLTVRVEGAIDTALSPDGKRLAVASWWFDEGGAVFDVATGEGAFGLSGPNCWHPSVRPWGVLESGRPIHRREQREQHADLERDDGKAPTHPGRHGVRLQRRLEPGLLSPRDGRFGWDREGVGDRGGGRPGALVTVGARDEERDRRSGVLAGRDQGDGRGRVGSPL